MIQKTEVQVSFLTFRYQTFKKKAKHFWLMQPNDT